MLNLHNHNKSNATKNFDKIFGNGNNFAHSSSFTKNGGMLIEEQTPMNLINVKNILTTNKFSPTIRKFILERNFICTEYVNTFTQESHLFEHQRIHAGEESHECNKDENIFIQKPQIEVPQSVYTRETFYMYSMWEGFYLRSNLVHIRKFILGRNPINAVNVEKPFSIDHISLDI